MTTLTGWLAIINLIFLVAGGIGGTLVFRSSLRKAENDVQERVLQAMSTENELLQSRVNRLEKENRRLNRVLKLLASTLKKTHGIELEIDDETIYVRGQTGTHIAHLDATDMSA